MASNALSLVFKGRTESIEASTPAALFAAARSAFDLHAFNVKLLLKGKQLKEDDDSTAALAALAAGTKIMVMASGKREASELNSQKSDPTIRSFASEDQLAKRHMEETTEKEASVWGPTMQQDKKYRFCRFEPVLWQAFGTRPTSTTPHAFEACALLLKLAMDPAVVHIMKEREYTVGLLAELDPIDDRHAEKMEGEGKRLLGYNQNSGARIYIRLRTEDLSGFLPYPSLVDTLLHELSHNMCGPHNEQFWHLFCQHKADYLRAHVAFSQRGDLFNGKSPLQLADAAEEAKDVRTSTLAALARDRQVPVNEMQVTMLDNYLAASKVMEAMGRRDGVMSSAEQRVGGAATSQPATAEERRALLAQRASERMGGTAPSSSSTTEVAHKVAAAASSRTTPKEGSAAAPEQASTTTTASASEEGKNADAPDVSDA